MNAARIDRVLITLWAAFLLSVPAAHGQLRGRVSGMVVDQTGGAIADASVTLFSEDRVRTAKTDQYGRFDFRDLPDGLDDLEISSPGFKTATMIDIQASDNGLYEILLEVGSFSGMTCAVRQDLAAANGISAIPFKAFKLAYEKRSEAVSASGTLRDAWGGPVDQAVLTLTNSREADSTYLARSNTEGEFYFQGVLSGRYTLRATHDNYYEFSTTIWITRENLTRLDRIYLLPKNIEYPCEQGF